jgi:two-component sensor histidine kinase
MKLRRSSPRGINRTVTQQRIAVRIFLALFLPVFLYATLDDWISGNTAEALGNTVMTAILVAVFVSRFLKLEPRREYVFTNRMILLFVIAFGSLILYMVSVEAELSRLTWGFLVIMTALLTIDLRTAVVLVVVFLAVTATVLFVPSMGGGNGVASGGVVASGAGAAPFDFSSRLFVALLFTAAISLVAVIIWNDYAEQVEKARDENALLLKELNHRVKNNLILVGALVDLKDQELGDAVDLSDIHHRIETITSIHDQLQLSDRYSEIEARPYFGGILDRVFAGSRHNIERFDEIDVGEVPSKTAVYLGLIVTEIATNAVKHGFASSDRSWFAIDFHENDGHYELRLKNSGNPFPQNVSLDHPETLGIQLITMLTEQLRGTIVLDRSPPTTYTIRIPIA